jgi:hypothetical protein
MFCGNCGTKSIENAKYCHSCGAASVLSVENEPINSNTSLVNEQNEHRSFETTRIVNWVVAYFLLFGLLLMIVKAPTIEGALIIFLAGFVFVGFSAMTAVAIGKGDFSVFGIYTVVNRNTHNLIIKISYIMNWLVGLLGVFGLASSLLTHQNLGVFLTISLYVILPYYNIKALKNSKQNIN